MARAEAARESNITSVAQRARKESQKVEEVAFIKAVSVARPLEQQAMQAVT